MAIFLGSFSLLELSMTISGFLGVGKGMSTPTTFFISPRSALAYIPLSSIFFNISRGVLTNISKNLNNYFYSTLAPLEY